MAANLLEALSRSVRLWIFFGVQSISATDRGPGPLLVLEPASRTYLTNNTGVTLRCAALGTPPPTITWQGAAGDVVTSHPGIRDLLPDGSLWLAPLTHAGSRSPRATFRCRASNPSGAVISRVTTLSTLLMSDVSVTAEGSTASIGGLGMIKCRVGGGMGGAVGGWVITSWLIQNSPTSIPVPVLDTGRYDAMEKRILAAEFMKTLRESVDV